MLPMTHPPLIDIPKEAQVYLAFAVPIGVWFQELRDQYADWKVRRMAGKIEAELREAGLIKKERDEPHLILLPGNTHQYECSECSQLFLLEQWQTTAVLADEFSEHLRVRHRSHYRFPIGVRVTLANSGQNNPFPLGTNDQD